MKASDDSAVRAVVHKYIQGTYTGNTVTLRECFHPAAVMNGYLNDQLLTGTPEPFFNDIENNPAMSDAGTPYRGEIVSVDVTGKVAGVTIKETGFAGGMAFTDYFHLIKVDGDWKIISKTFTTE